MDVGLVKIGSSEWAFVNNLLVPFTTSYKKKINDLSKFCLYDVQMYIEHFYSLMEHLVGKLKDLSTVWVLYKKVFTILRILPNKKLQI